MKVLYFMNHVGRGGAALALLDLIKEIKTRHEHIEPIVITGSFNELNEALSAIGVENYSAPFKNFLSTYKKPTFFWKFLLQIRYCISAPFAKKKIESVVDFKKIAIIHSNLNRIDIGYYFAKKYGIPHLWHIREHGDSDFPLMQIFPNYNPILNDKNSNLIVISKSVKSVWINRGICRDKIHLIYDGINTDFWTNRNNEKKFEKLSFIFVGGLHVNKGQEIFINALNLLPDEIKENINVHFYGEGPSKYKHRLAQMISKFRLENTCQIFDYDPQIYNRLGQYHIGVNCSQAEGFGRITVEYMLAGLCPLVSANGANIEIVDDKKNGLLFSRNLLDDICEKIKYLYNNRKIIDKLSINAKEKAAINFSMRVHTSRICDLYKQTINA